MEHTCRGSALIIGEEIRWLMKSLDLASRHDWLACSTICSWLSAMPRSLDGSISNDMASELQSALTMGPTAACRYATETCLEYVAISLDATQLPRRMDPGLRKFRSNSEQTITRIKGKIL